MNLPNGDDNPTLRDADTGEFLTEPDDRATLQAGRSDFRGPGLAGKASEPSGRPKAGDEPIPGYLLEGYLGRGAFAEVWKASGPGGVAVALKFLPIDGEIGEGESRSLELIKNVHHPHLTGVSAIWRVGNQIILSMELADGTLRDALSAQVSEGRTGIDPDQLVEFIREAAKGIDHLNRSGIVHRDIKPQNLLLMSGGVKVADFGLARLIDHSPDPSRSSMTPSYAAPELCQGSPGSRTDQYALAVTYCELRGNRLPFRGMAVEVISGHLFREPDLSMLDESERPAVARALAKKPEDRWPNCLAFASALSDARTADLPRARPVSRRRFAAALGGTGLLAASAATTAAWVRLAGSDPLETIRRAEIEREVRAIRSAEPEVIRSPPANHFEVDRIDRDDNDGFEIYRDERVVDLRGWRDVPDDKLGEPIGWVTQTRHLWMKKSRAVDVVRFQGRTSGLDVFYRSDGRFPFRQASQRLPSFVGDERLKVREILIDVSSIGVGEDFTLKLVSTYWNSIQSESEQWFGVIGYRSTALVSQLILFPDNRPFRSIQLKTAATLDKGRATDYRGTGSLLTGPRRDWINWDILDVEPGRVYQVHWSW